MHDGTKIFGDVTFKSLQQKLTNPHWLTVGTSKATRRYTVQVRPSFRSPNPPPFHGYYKYITDQDYVKRKNYVEFEKIYAWRKASMDILVAAAEDPNMPFPTESYKDQYFWVKKVAKQICESVKDFEMLPVDMLNPYYIGDLIDGADTDEKVNFVYKITHCNRFSLVFLPNTTTNNFQLVTEFSDWDGMFRHAVYGKKDDDVDYSKYCSAWTAKVEFGDVLDEEVISKQDGLVKTK